MGFDCLHHVLFQFVLIQYLQSSNSFSTGSQFKAKHLLEFVTRVTLVFYRVVLQLFFYSYSLNKRFFFSFLEALIFQVRSRFDRWT